MLDVILESALLIACGVLWRLVRPLGLDAETVRRSLTGVVYVLLLPALVLTVLWRAPLSLDAVRVALSALFGLVVAGLLAWAWFRGGRHPNYVVGALLLAAVFPNATYLGLPVLEASLGPWARSIAIQYDLFACTPLLLSGGVMLAARYGGVREVGHPLLALLKVPPLWAAVVAVALNLMQVPVPHVLGGVLDMLSPGVVPLMLFSLGLGLRWDADALGRMPALIPVLLIQLVLTPLAVWGFAGLLGLQGGMLTGVVLEAAMPAMVLGIVLCDRFGLDTALYAMAVTLSTALSMLTLPLWFSLLGGGAV